jgi:WD40 repeat protein/DNA-binding SARP family transcriptional activator
VTWAYASAVEFGLLGPLEVIDGSEACSLGGPKQRTVLVHLLLRANRAVTQEQLIDEVWGDDPPPTARGSLQSYVSRLRSALGSERLEGHAGRYVLHAAPDELDTARFEALVAEARRRAASDPAAAAATYRTAFGVWRGPALEDLADEPSLRPEVVRLEELRLAATEEWIAAELALGRHRELIADVESLAGRHPFRERLWGQLMVALYRSGRQREALDAYRRVRDTLGAELGIDPSPELRRLREQVVLQDPALDVVGQPLRGYRLIERVGEGTFGTVHRAFQPEVGREVAVKIIRPELANHPEFIRRFGAEAQLVARLEHPHIVPLYDYWREPDGAYLVMRYLRGGSLREALAHGALQPDRVVPLIEHVALALASAHRQGVVHRDVKPANILFDDEGNAYLSDFGIAKELAVAEPGGRGGTPSPLAAYLSPEEARGEAVTPRADIYSLGVVAFEALAGRHPFADTSPDSLIHRHAREALPSLRAWCPDLPPAIDGAIACATAKDPAERPADAVALASALRDALAPLAGPARRPAAPVEARNPYKGLRPFVEADAADFFGRDQLVDELVTRIGEPEDAARFLAVVGPSGSGKSSLVRAGLVPALRRGAVPGSDGWYVVELHPGAHPFDELAAALTRVAVTPLTGLVKRLRQDGAGLFRVAADILPAGPAQLLVVIDQFEEVFTLVNDEGERARFLSALAIATTDPRSRVRVVVTLRADLYDRPLSHPGIAELMKARTVTVTPLAPGDLERAIAGPAQAVGVAVDTALVAALVAEVADQPASLPLLQYALTELFERRDGGRLTLDAHNAVGGVSGALARRAEDLYGRLPPPGQEAARQLFLRLVTLGDEGSEDTRRRVPRTELSALDVAPEAMDAAVDAFGARRLLTFDRDPVTRGPTVEVAHEALLREWARLHGWIEAARDDVRAHRRLAAAAGEWVEAGRDASFLLRGDRLRRSETWMDTSSLALTDAERDYLEASVARRDAERATEEARATRERTLERRSLVRLRVVVAVLAALALVASGLTALALDQRQQARQEARAATARELAAAAVASLDQDPERSILLASEAVDVTRRADGVVLREAEEALHRAVKSSRLVRTVPQGGFGLAVSSDGARFVTGGSARGDGTATVWDANTGEALLVLRGPGGAPGGVALSPDDRLVATIHADETARIWDAATGEQRRVLRGHGADVTRPAFSPDGRWLAVGGEGGSVRIWDVAAGTEEMTLAGHLAPVHSAAFSPDGSRLVTARDTTAHIWDLATGKVVVTLTGHAWDVTSAVFSPDGRRVATASVDAEARIWDAETGALLQTFAGPSSLEAVAFSPDGTRLAAVGSDALARVWDVETGRELLTLAGPTGGGLLSVAFSPDGDRLLASGRDDTRVWDISVAGARDWLTVPSVELILAGVAFSPDGTTFAAPAEPAGVTIWDAETGDEVIKLTGPEQKLTTVAFSPDGAKLAAGSDLTGAPPVWDVRTGELLFTLGHPFDTVRAVAFSPDGTRIVTGGWDGTARAWDATTGEPTDVLRANSSVVAVAHSPDGGLLVTGEENGTVEVWDAVTLERRRTLVGHTSAVLSLAFGPDRMLVTASDDSTAKVWDLASGGERITFRGHRAGVTQIAVGPDGTQVATTSDDATTKLWDPATGRELLTLVGHDNLVSGVAFSPDGRLLATASPDGTTALHLLPIDEFQDLARERVTRGFTEQECRDYLRVTPCP